ncbi:MAG: SAVED domain-containing protein [Thiobacillus sp.]
MQTVLDFIRDVLDPIGIVVGLIIAIPVFWTWWQVVFGEYRQRRRWLAEISQHPGERPGILIIDLLPGKDIGASVRHHLSSDDGLKAVPEERIASIARDAALKPEDIIAYADELRRAARRLLDAGCDVIHLFYGGPAVGAAIVGAELSNGPRVVLYHHEQGRYIRFGPLEPLRYGH